VCFDLKINGQEDILFELRKRYGNPFEENQ